MYRKFLRPGWIVGHLLVVVAALVCVRLGRWQWHRMQDGGTVQNLGYAILWPVFGAAFIYMWFRFLQLETLKDAEDDAELTAMAAGDGPLEAQGAGPADVPIAGRRTEAEDAAIAENAPVAPEPPDGMTPDGMPAAPTELPPVGVASAEIDFPQIDAPSLGADPLESTDAADAVGVAPVGRRSRRTPSRGRTVAVSTVGDENEDEDPELAAYNRALAALAEKDHRRAR